MALLTFSSPITDLNDFLDNDPSFEDAIPISEVEHPFTNENSFTWTGEFDFHKMSPIDYDPFVDYTGKRIFEGRNESSAVLLNLVPKDIEDAARALVRMCEYTVPELISPTSPRWDPEVWSQQFPESLHNDFDDDDDSQESPEPPTKRIRFQ